MSKRGVSLESGRSSHSSSTTRNRTSHAPPTRINGDPNQRERFPFPLGRLDGSNLTRLMRGVEQGSTDQARAGNSGSGSAGFRGMGGAGAAGGGSVISPSDGGRTRV